MRTVQLYLSLVTTVLLVRGRSINTRDTEPGHAEHDENTRATPWQPEDEANTWQPNEEATPWNPEETKSAKDQKVNATPWEPHNRMSMNTKKTPPEENVQATPWNKELKEVTRRE